LEHDPESVLSGVLAELGVQADVAAKELLNAGTERADDAS
jgi:hypothetical protein